MPADLVADVSAAIGAAAALATFILGLVILVTTRKTHDAVNGAAAAAGRRIDQLTQVIANAPHVELPDHPNHQ